MRKIDEKWKELIDDNPHILKEINDLGYYEITSTFIGAYKEARLMCKIDEREMTPKILKDNYISILANKNSKYILARTDPFLNFDETKIPLITPTTVTFPFVLETLPVNDISSESKALDCAYHSGMLASLTHSKEYLLTIRGRFYCTKFNFELPQLALNGVPNGNSVEYEVESVQVEVDGGYESESKILLVEAKMKNTGAMNIRQLLYPHLHYSKVCKKEVVSYYLVCDNKTNTFKFVPFVVKGKLFYFDYPNSRVFKLI